MDWSARYIVFILCGLLFSCGQVGTITGGSVDNEAPKPIQDEVRPPLASINTYPETIEIPFNEFIALNKPAENIKVTPNDVKLDYSIKGKSLLLEVKEGTWKENTTYSIALNRAIKDITEANDSIMYYVFSTGSFIDSLKCSFVVNDAYDETLIENVTVGLFQQPVLDDTSEMDPRYVSISGKNGRADFQYLKEGEYHVYAFEDDNKNNQLDANERRGKVGHPIRPHPQDTILDTLQLMPPVINELLVLNNEFISPGIWCIGFNRAIDDNESVNFLGADLIESRWNSKKDSLTFYLKNDMSGAESFILNSSDLNDTVSKRFFFKELPDFSFSSNLNNNKLRFGDTLVLVFNDAIAEVKPELIRCSIMIDSTENQINPTFVISEANKVRITGFDRNSVNNITINFLPESILGHNNSNKDTMELQFETGLEKELGTLIVSLDTVPTSSVLILKNQQGKEVQRKKIVNNEKVRFSNLSAGRYFFSILLDENNNGYWDTGDVFRDIKPEKILWFESSSTVRANWEVETTLEVSNKLR